MFNVVCEDLAVDPSMDQPCDVQNPKTYPQYAVPNLPVLSGIDSRQQLFEHSKAKKIVRCPTAFIADESPSQLPAFLA